MVNHEKNPDLWTPEILRFTGFLENATFESETVFKFIAEADALISTTDRKRGFQKSVGDFGENSLSVVVWPNKVDVVLGTKEGEMSVLMNGNFPDVLTPFCNRVETFLRPPGFFRRIAFGAILQKEVPTIAAGYEEIQDLLPSVKLDVGNCSDFLFQINRPRTVDLGEKNIRINRFSKWSVAQWFIQGIMVGTRPVEIARPNPDTDVHCGIRLEMDINTADEMNIPAGNEQTIWRKCCEFGIELSEKGDIK